MNNITSFDIIKQRVTTESLTLSFQDLSTGQSSSMYLAHSLSNPDNKKLLVIFDEIGNMDDQSLSPVIKKLNENESQGNLVFALLAKVDDNVKGLKVEYIKGVKRIGKKQKLEYI